MRPPSRISTRSRGIAALCRRSSTRSADRSPLRPRPLPPRRRRLRRRADDCARAAAGAKTPYRLMARRARRDVAHRLLDALELAALLAHRAAFVAIVALLRAWRS